MTLPGEAALRRTGVPTLRVALGDYPHTRAFKSSPAAFAAFAAEFADISPINRAFAPMIRDLCFDVSEMALFTFLQAKAYGKPLVLLPVTLAARFQETALLCRADDTRIQGPGDLAGRSVGVRAYSQTTAAWLRGILDHDHGVRADAVRWVTFEGAHVAEYQDPPWARRAATGEDMAAMLRGGALDAIVVGNDPPDDRALRTVFPDPDAAARRFRRQHGFVPVNHVMVARRPLADSRPDLVVAFVDALGAAMPNRPAGGALPFGRGALQPAIDLALSYAAEQDLLPRALPGEEVWEGLPAELLSSCGRARP